MTGRTAERDVVRVESPGTPPKRAPATDRTQHLDDASTTVIADDTAPDANAAASPDFDCSPSAEFLDVIPHDYARRHLLLSEGTREGHEALRITDRTPATAAFNVGVRLARPIHTRLAPAEELAAAIDRAYAMRAESTTDPSRDGDLPAVVIEGSVDVDADLAQAARDADVLHTQGKAPAVRLVDLLFFEALLRSASDVHVQPLRDRVLVRYRLDGTLHTVRELPASVASAVVSRIKVMARLDLAERRAPQDGRAAITIGRGEHAGRRVDLRVSTIPSTFGERVVVRLLDPARSPHLSSFAALGMPAEVESRWRTRCAMASGIALSTGPTGSGKTTTLYATLAWISARAAGGQARGCELNIMTIEDPVEYDLSSDLAITQMQVDSKKKVTFAAGLRHILRQDPDVIMVGEIRDEETARMAVQASLTGHLVLSTLHTESAVGAPVRLIDLGVEPFLVSSSLSVVLAQRLVRKVHGDCGGAGCEGCLSTGWKGRTGVFELLMLDAMLRDMVGERESAGRLRDEARRRGMTTLRESGLRLVGDGITTTEEVARVIDWTEEGGDP